MSNLTLRQGFAPQTMNEAIQFSEMLSKSQMVPKQYQNKPEDILVAVQWGYEIGLAPMQALQNISVINGRPSVYGDAAMALVQSSPACEDIEEFMEAEGTPNPVAVCIAKRKGRKPVTAKFSVEDAKRANLWGKQGPWTQYPKRMLQMRARGFALRDAFPDVLKGLITAEEAQDYPSDTVEAPKPIPRAVELLEQFDAEPPEGHLALYVPGVQDPYSWHEDTESWIKAYQQLVNKINWSNKLSKEDKDKKIWGLETANSAVVEGFDSFDRVKLKAAIAETGVDPLKKPPVSQDEVPSESES